MKFLKFARSRFHFHFAREERVILFQLLDNYPLLPEQYHKGSLKAGLDALAPTEEVLEEAMREHRIENRRQLEKMLKSRGRFRKNQEGYKFSLTRGEIEWLLQVLNDLRVGCWILLGRPDEQESRLMHLREEPPPLCFTMELCAHVQMFLLHAMETSEKPRGNAGD